MDKHLHVERDARKRFNTTRHLSEHGAERVDSPVLLEEGNMNAKSLLRILREAQQEYLITYIDDDGDEKEHKISAASPAEARSKVKKFAKEIVDVETLSEEKDEKTANCRNCGERNDSPSGKYCKKCQKEITRSGQRNVRSRPSQKL